MSTLHLPLTSRNAQRAPILAAEWGFDIILDASCDAPFTTARVIGLAIVRRPRAPRPYALVAPPVPAAPPPRRPCTPSRRPRAPRRQRSTSTPPPEIPAPPPPCPARWVELDPEHVRELPPPPRPRVVGVVRVGRDEIELRKGDDIGMQLRLVRERRAVEADPYGIADGLVLEGDVVADDTDGADR